MTDLYQVLRNPSIENLHEYDIEYFDDLAREYPDQYRNIISYINDCFNYHSPLIVEEKDWGIYLRERYRANNLPEDMESAIIQLESPQVVIAIDEFLTHQKQPTFQTLVAKQNLRKAMLATLQSFSASLSDKKTANELVTSLDDEINDIYERMRQEQKKLGNYKGYDHVKSARAKIKIGLINFID